MKRTRLLIAIATLPLVSACTSGPTYKTDPRARASGSVYLNTDAASGGGTGGGSGSGARTRVIVSEPQPVPIRVKPGTQPPRYQNSTSQYDQADPASTASPLRHDKPDQPLYPR